MADRQTYHEKTDLENIRKLRGILAALPPFVKDFFRAIDATTSTRTRISYAYDIRVFFQFLQARNPVWRNTPLDGFRVSDLDLVTARDIEEYMEYLKLYEKDSSDGPSDASEGSVTENTANAGKKSLSNHERGLKRKISSLRTFYAYYFRHEMIRTNPTVLVDMPKVHERTIVRLDPDEVASLLDYMEQCGESLTGQSKAYYEKTKIRDITIVTLLLGTGIRVSECVGLDVEDIDFRNNGLRIVRKGGNESIVYFGSEVEKALRTYLEERRHITPVPGHEHALFYSMQRKRIQVRSVENLVGKYTKNITSVKKITPHKLRSTYGTSLYRETGDIYLVADVLGHKDVNTTRRHYAAMDEDRRRKAAGAVRLREE